MTDLASDFGVPAEVKAFVDSGFLVPLSENTAEKTVEFHVPAMRYEDESEAITTFSLTWIHPDHNADYCHYYDETPGDLPNFYMFRETSNSPDDQIELETVDDLIDWLETHQLRVLRKKSMNQP